VHAGSRSLPSALQRTPESYGYACSGGASVSYVLLPLALGRLALGVGQRLTGKTPSHRSRLWVLKSSADDRAVTAPAAAAPALAGAATAGAAAAATAGMARVVAGEAEGAAGAAGGQVAAAAAAAASAIGGADNAVRNPRKKHKHTQHRRDDGRGKRPRKGDAKRARKEKALAQAAEKCQYYVDDHGTSNERASTPFRKLLDPLRARARSLLFAGLPPSPGSGVGWPATVGHTCSCIRASLSFFVFPNGCEFVWPLHAAAAHDESNWDRTMPRASWTPPAQFVTRSGHFSPDYTEPAGVTLCFLSGVHPGFSHVFFVKPFRRCPLSGLRRVRPYTYDFQTHAKERWLERSVIDVFSECMQCGALRREARLVSPCFLSVFMFWCKRRGARLVPPVEYDAMAFTSLSAAKCSNSSRNTSNRRPVFAPSRRVRGRAAEPLRERHPHRAPNR